MLNTNVLVLNRSYMPIHLTSARRAFTLIYQDVARAVDAEYQTFDFDAWRRLPAHGVSESIGTPSGSLRVPRVIVLRHYDRVPKRHLRYSRVNVFARDKFTCQYCGARPPPVAAELGPRDPARVGWQDDVGERGGELRGLQSTQGRAHSAPGKFLPDAEAGAAALDSARQSDGSGGAACRVASLPRYRR